MYEKHDIFIAYRNGKVCLWEMKDMMITSYVIFSGKGFLLVFPLQRYEHTIDNDRLALSQFHQSEFGQHVYSQRSISVEPLIEHMKDMFAIDPLPVRGFYKARSIVLLSVLLYQVMVYYIW